ncbi:MAG: hypothetical protein A2571_00310 [Candidatus Vogelbacteria bacterium RIFOXYD1_FULL_44_32]|uniref:Uncharacterized protein n=1 Tax=Candidatus Vogelbacteria bacterium RIFOXYD1_FULL_44_32 TaxID=1802438 RepID=A0A1G2QE05_9BACT|nr:MAG: hypothetical protein A2571_00310 [Candidatus Vogelbacteria bacterium RIFOXYD1_FULL_44_32]
MVKKSKKVTEKTYEVFLDLLRSKKFVNDVIKFRKNNEIPENGFADDPMKILDTKWKDPERKLKAEVKLAEFLKRYDLPPSAHDVASSYIVDGLTPEVAIAEGHMFYGCSIENPSNKGTYKSSEPIWRASGKKYVSLLIHEGAKVSDVKKYVEYNWDQIEEIISVPLGEKNNQKVKKRIRMKVNRLRDERVASLSRKSKDVLRSYLSSEKRLIRMSKNAIIAELMRFLYGDKVSVDNVRQIMSRYKQK